MDVLKHLARKLSCHNGSTTLWGRLSLLVVGLFFATSVLTAQNTVTITGTVKDTDGFEVIGATVLVEGHQGLGASTNLDGRFTLKNVPANATLTISYVGMKTQRIDLQSINPPPYELKITLESDSELLDEVVVTALGIERSEKALAYNVQEIKSDALNTVKDANFINSLSGKVAGVNITRSSAGIGGATRVVMRGSKSIMGGNNVLYVVDGMPMGNRNIAGDGGEYGRPGGGEGISDFNPDDIESISVLTGPSAAALYGASAANGVIIINTKKGQAGALRVNFSSNTEMLTPGIMPEFQNTYGSRPNSYRSWGEKLAEPSGFNPRCFFQTGYSTINSVNLSGGTEKNQTFVSVATTNSRGIIPNNEYYRYNFTGRNTSNFFDNKLHLDISGSYVLQGDQNMMSGGRYFNPLRPLYLFPRGDNFDNVKVWERFDPIRNISTQYWPYGDQGEDFENPYWIINREMFNNDKHRYMFNASVVYDIADWLNVAARVRIDNTYTTRLTRFHASSSPLRTGDNATKPMGSYSRNEERYKQTYADLMFNIDKTFATDWRITANIGTSFDDHYISGIGIGGRLKSIPNLFSAPNLDADARNPGGETRERWRTIGLFASSELSWRSMIYLTLTGRSDWASQLVSNGKTPAIFYPSVGLSLLLSEMMPMPEFISYLKLRGSFTEVGSPITLRGVTPGTVTYEIKSGVITPLSTFPYPHFRPERTRSYEVGVNARFFGGTVSVDATLYQSNTYNQTFNQELPPSSGYSSFYLQAGDIRNRGIELAVGYDNTWGKVGFSSTLTYTRNVNRVMQLAKGYTNPIDGTKFDIDVLKSPKYMRVGDSMSDMFLRGILVKGQDGRFIEDGDGFKVDRTQLIKVGKTDPDFMMGWSNTLSAYGFNLSFLISARVGGLTTSSTQAMMDGFGVSKVTADARDAGAVIVDGESYDPERYYTTIGTNRLTAYYLYDATNVKLQELSIGYSIPKEYLGGVLNSASLSLIGRNLLNIYRAAPYDTDMAGGTGTYSGGNDNFMPPSVRSFGFNLKLGI